MSLRNVVKLRVRRLLRERWSERPRASCRSYFGEQESRGHARERCLLLELRLGRVSHGNYVTYFNRDISRLGNFGVAHLREA